MSRRRGHPVEKGGRRVPDRRPPNPSTNEGEPCDARTRDPGQLQGSHPRRAIPAPVRPSACHGGRRVLSWEPIMVNPWGLAAVLRAVLLGLTSALTTGGVTLVIVLGAHRLGLDRPGLFGAATAAGLFVVAALLKLIGRRATRQPSRASMTVWRLVARLFGQLVAGRARCSVWADLDNGYPEPVNGVDTAIDPSIPWIRVPAGIRPARAGLRARAGCWVRGRPGGGPRWRRRAGRRRESLPLRRRSQAEAFRHGPRRARPIRRRRGSPGRTGPGRGPARCPGRRRAAVRRPSLYQPRR